MSRLLFFLIIETGDLKLNPLEFYLQPWSGNRISFNLNRKKMNSKNQDALYQYQLQTFSFFF